MNKGIVHNQVQLDESAPEPLLTTGFEPEGPPSGSEEERARMRAKGPEGERKANPRGPQRYRTEEPR